MFRLINTGKIGLLMSLRKRCHRLSKRHQQLAKVWTDKATAYRAIPRSGAMVPDETSKLQQMESEAKRYSDLAQTESATASKLKGDLDALGVFGVKTKVGV